MIFSGMKFRVYFLGNFFRLFPNMGTLFEFVFKKILVCLFCLRNDISFDNLAQRNWLLLRKKLESFLRFFWENPANVLCWEKEKYCKNDGKIMIIHTKIFFLENYYCWKASSQWKRAKNIAQSVVPNETRFERITFFETFLIILAKIK